MKRIAMLVLGLLWTATSYAACPCCGHETANSENETVETKGVEGEHAAVSEAHGHVHTGAHSE